MQALKTGITSLELVGPEPNRDAPFATQWLTGETGKQTLLLMGNTSDEILPTSYSKEYETISEFLDLERNSKQLTWAIRLEDKTIGFVWVELKDKDLIPAPAISIMIGDISARGKGIGKGTMLTVLRHLKKEGTYDRIYARHLLENKASGLLLKGLGFIDLQKPYQEKNGLTFQNVVLDLTSVSDSPLPKPIDQGGPSIDTF